MDNWQQKVWDYSAAGSMPDEGYWMRLLACQWISNLEVIQRPQTIACTGDRSTTVLRPSKSSTLPRSLTMPSESVQPQRIADRFSNEPSQPSPARQLPKLMQQSKKRPEAHTTNSLTGSKDRAHVGELACSCSVFDSVDCEKPGPPPGLDSPTTLGRWPVWHFEKDPRKRKWLPMSSALSWHLEECYSLGLTETWVAENNMHYYFDLRAMCQRDPQTGTEHRIQRLMV